VGFPIIHVFPSLNPDRDSDLSEEEWLKEYRSLKVLEVQINSCLRVFWLPFNLFGVMLMTVISTVLVFRIHLGLTMTGVFSTLAFISFVAQFHITYFASNSAAYSKEAIKLQRKKHNNRLESKALLACKPFGMKSGSFRTLDKEAMLIVMMANVDYVISSLLAF
jgi:hypothetical protein